MNTPNQPIDLQILKDLNESSRELERASRRVADLLGRHSPGAVMDCLSRNERRAERPWARFLESVASVQANFAPLVQEMRRRLEPPEGGPPKP